MGHMAQMVQTWSNDGIMTKMVHAANQTNGTHGTDGTDTVKRRDHDTNGA